MAVRDDFAPGEVLTASDLNDTLAQKADVTNIVGRNLLYNGAMQVAQRGTSTSGITTSGYYTADRWRVGLASLGTWTQSLENDAPSGSGFSKSVKMLCTTASASPSATGQLHFQQSLEGQDLQRIAKGTAAAQQLTVSFWVKSNVTGTYIAALLDNDNTRYVAATYSISASATWEKKIITFPADTTGALDNDNGNSFQFRSWLGAGSNFTSGTLATSWAATTDATTAVGQTNLAAATNNYWQITGVQLEVGPAATPFEFKSFGQELRECQRYFQKSYNYSITPGSASNLGAYMHPLAASGNTLRATIFFKTNMRAAPTVTIYNPETGTAGYWTAEGQGSSNQAAGAVTFISDFCGLAYSTNAPISGHFYFQWKAEVEL